jgi:hypothetical protein
MSEPRFDPPRSDAPGNRWGADQAGPRQARPQPALDRFLGGSPAAVFIRLLFVSAVVGAVLMWLRIRPIDIILNIEELFHRLWNLGFDAVREIADYILAGAIIVVPIWLVIRLLNFRGDR